MKIAMVAPFEESVPPAKYGGTEVVVYNLITELARLGHDVTLFATGDSKVPCRLVPIFPTSLRTTEPYASDTKTREMAKILGIAKTIERLHSEQFDIVHNHLGWRFLLFSNFFRGPTVTTLHGPLGDTYQHMIIDNSPDHSFVSISDNQQKGMPNLQFIQTVYNGIDLSLYPFQEKPDGDYLFFLARFSPEKGAREAIEIAKKSGKKLLMAVKVDHADRTYFEANRGLIDGEQIQLLGEMSLSEKVKYLQHATALLAPIQWEEPFGLFVVEAMACGTPVLGTSRGSFPELITHGNDGFLGSTVDELASYVAKIGTIDRRACRMTAEGRFSKVRMAADYLEVYKKVIAKGQKNLLA